MTTSDTNRAEPLFERLRAKAKRLPIDGEEYFRIEGDLLLDEIELRQYALERQELEQARDQIKQADLPLVAMLEMGGGRIIRWAPEIELSYAVLRSTFVEGQDAGYELVVDSIRRAAADWEATCGVRFKHEVELDGSDSLRPAGALFVLREFNAKGVFIASAFFPSDPISRRRVFIDPSFYSPTLGFNRVGVLRHELGHVLGFRHEHIRKDGAPPGCPGEDTYGTINETDYDPQSVMHYFCGGIGSTDLMISELDKKAAQHIYGPPLSRFQLIR